MFEQLVRNKYQRYCLAPVAGLLPSSLNPIAITITGLLCGCLFLPFLLLGHQYLALVCLIGSGYLDSIDGYFARLHASTSDLGCILDIIADRVVEFVVVLALFLQLPLSRGLACMAMLGSILLCVTSFLVVGMFSSAVQTQKGFFYSIGLMERAEAFLFFLLMVLFPQCFNWLAALFVGLVVLTAVLHVWKWARLRRVA